MSSTSACCLKMSVNEKPKQFCYRVNNIKSKTYNHIREAAAVRTGTLKAHFYSYIYIAPPCNKRARLTTAYMCEKQAKILSNSLVPIHVIQITFSGETVETIYNKKERTKRERMNRLYTNSDARFFWMSRIEFRTILSFSI